VVWSHQDDFSVCSGVVPLFGWVDGVQNYPTQAKIGLEWGAWQREKRFRPCGFAMSGCRGSDAQTWRWKHPGVGEKWSEWGQRT
jgi:hypothetical protein